jgi:hypothetical protein
MIRVTMIALLGLVLLTTEVHADCADRCADVFSACLTGDHPGTREQCFKLFYRCLDVCPYQCFRKDRKGQWGPINCFKLRRQ